MPGLLDFANTDDGMQALGLLAAAAPSMEPMNLAGRMAMAGNAYNALKDNALRRQFTASQIANLNSEAAQRSAQTEKMRQGLAMLSGVLGGGGSASYEPGQLGSGSFGIVPNADPLAPGQRNSGLAGATADQIAAINAYTGVNLMEPWKVAKEGFTKNPGTYTVDANTGKVTYNVDPTKSIDYDPGTKTVSLLKGAPDATTALTLATEAPKTLLNSAATVNLRPNADGTQSPVSALSENPTLQGVLGQLFGGRLNLPAGTSAGSPAGLPGVAPGGSVVSAADQRARDAESVRMLQSELGNPNLPPDQKAGLQRELDRLTAAQSQPGFPTPSLIRNPQGYGMTNAQAATAAAQTEAAKTRAMGAEKYGQDYQAALNDKVDNEFQLVNRNKMILPLLDKFQTGGFAPDERLHFANALQNSGMLPAGMRDKVASWVTGGDPTAGKVIENQIASAAITTMLDTLNKEGKPNRAIFQQLQKAQEGLQSGNTTLKDVFALQKQLYDIHYNEQQALNKAVKDGSYDPRTWAADYSSIRNAGLSQPSPALPSSSAKPAPMATKTAALPAPMKGMIRGGYKFKGGDPTNPANWEKQ